MDRKILKGNYDLYITDICNLHCKGCIVLDYKGKVTIPFLTLETIIGIMDNIDRLGLKFEQLQLVGGEPTLHPKFTEIVAYLRENHHLYDRLSIVTNGTNYNEKTIPVFRRFESVVHTDYMMLNGGKVTDRKDLPNFVTKVYVQNGFDDYFVKDENTEYSARQNWDRCFQKSECNSVTEEGIYHCPITMNERTEVMPYENADDMVDFANRDEPLDFCAQCPFPPKRMPWESKRPKTDLRVFKKGYDNMIKVRNI